MMGTVQVILNEDVHALGNAGEVVSVKPGFARNFLVPQGKAVLATTERVHQVEERPFLYEEVPASRRPDECIPGMLEPLVQRGRKHIVVKCT